MKLSCFIAAVFCILLTSPYPSAASQFSGQTVTDIVIQDDRGNPWPDPAQIERLIGVRPGAAFSNAVISSGISYVYLTGRFKDVRVDGFPENNGVKLIYTLVPITIVEKIVIRGNRVLSKSKIMEVLSRVQDRQLREDKFEEYRSSLAALYQSEGYYGTEINFKVEHTEFYRATMSIYIREPNPTVIENISFSGNTVFTQRQLLGVMKNRPGGRLKTDVLFDEDIAAIRQKYSAAGYPTAQLGPINISFRDEKAYVHIEGREGPKVSVQFSGNHAFSEKELGKQILIWSENDFSDSIIDSSADKIKNLYRAEGYDAVKIVAQTTETPGKLDIVFEIQEGQRITVEEIILHGNRHFSTRQIKREIPLQEPGWFSAKPFEQKLADKSVDYIRERYLEAGFLSVEVKKKVDFIKNGTKAKVALDIHEGPQTRTGSIRFEGNTAFTDVELHGRLSLKPNAPYYNERLVDEDHYRILSAYSDQGYLYAEVNVAKKQTNGAIDITYQIEEDHRVAIGSIILRGNDRTKDSVIMREILLKPGDPYNYERILKSQQRIYRFGYFNLARFEPIHPGEKEYVKDMIFSVEERPAGAFEIGVGYGDLDRTRAFLEVSHRNVWGLAHYAGVRFEESSILKRAIMNYQHPWFFAYDLQGKFALTWSDFKHINSDTREIYYQTRQNSASYGLEKKLNDLRALLTYADENVENYNVAEEARLSEKDKGHVRVSSLSPALVWDFRDDIFNPRKGALYGIVLKQAMHQLGSQADFTKLIVQTSWYLPLGSGIVTALSARGGMAWPHYQTKEIPIHERFTLGGNTTIRGYTQDLVGSEGTISIGENGKPIPIGGSAMAQLNAELRLMPSGGFGFVLFYDAGNVWKEQDIMLDDLRASFGAGIRYGTPVGPLRIDYGQKINRKPGESPGELHFNIGHTF